MLSPIGPWTVVLFLVLAACGEAGVSESDAGESDERRVLLEQHSQLVYQLSVARLWVEDEEEAGGAPAPLEPELPGVPFGVVAKPVDKDVARSIAVTLSTEPLREAIADLERQLEAAIAAGR